MKISGIDWISESIREAEVTVTDGFHEILCFCYPCDYQVGDELDVNLQAEFVKDVFVSESEDFLIQQQKGWSYFMRGRVIDLADHLLEIFGFIIDIGEYSFSGDTKQGDMLEFFVGRMNVY